MELIKISLLRPTDNVLIYLEYLRDLVDGGLKT